MLDLSNISSHPILYGILFLGLYATLKALGVIGHSGKAPVEHEDDTEDDENMDEDDESESDDEDDDDDEDEIKTCPHCKINTDCEYQCDECGEDYCENCVIAFEDADVQICKDCINKEYPREKEIVRETVTIEVPTETVKEIKFSDTIL